MSINLKFATSPNSTKEGNAQRIALATFIAFMESKKFFLNYYDSQVTGQAFGGCRTVSEKIKLIFEENGWGCDTYIGKTAILTFKENDHSLVKLKIDRDFLIEPDESGNSFFKVFQEEKVNSALMEEFIAEFVPLYLEEISKSKEYEHEMQSSFTSSPEFSGFKKIYTKLKGGCDSEVKQRLNGEKRVIGNLVWFLNSRGFKLRKLDDGEDVYIVDRHLSAKEQEAVAIDSVFSVDESKLVFQRRLSSGEVKNYAVYIVLGNSPEEVISDHSVEYADSEHLSEGEVGFSVLMDEFGDLVDKEFN